MRTGGGRVKSAIWQYFTTTTNEDSPNEYGKNVIFCNFCQQQVSPKAQRLQNHLDKCSAFQDQQGGSIPSATTTSGTKDKNKKPPGHPGHLETQLKRMLKSIKRLEQTIENIRNWVSNSYGDDIPEECFVVDDAVENTMGINNETEDLINDVKNEFDEPEEDEAAAVDDDGYFNFDPSFDDNDLIDECLNKKTDENMSNLLDDVEMQKVQNQNDSTHKRKRTRTLKEMDNDFNNSDDLEFILPDTQDNDDDHDLDYGKRRRISQSQRTKLMNYNFINNDKKAKNSLNAKCRICKRVFKSVSYLNYIHMPTHKGVQQVQKKSKTGGRTKSAVWQFFTQIEEEIDGKIFQQAICNFCNQYVSAKAPRLQNHLYICPGQDVKASTRAHSDSDNDNDNTTMKTRKIEIRKKGYIRFGGRLKSDIWKYYNTTTEQVEGKFFKVSTCRKCSKYVSSKVDRLQKHFDICSVQKDQSVTTPGLETRPTPVPVKRKYNNNIHSGGRTKSDIWQYFKTTTEQIEGKFFKVSICRNCGKNVSSKAPRLQKHFDICSVQKDPSFSTPAGPGLDSRPTPVPVKRKNNNNKHSGGRTKSDIWQFFTTSKTSNEDGKVVDVFICNFCKNRVSPKASRLQSHIEKCPAYHADEGESPFTGTEQADTSTPIPNQTLTCQVPKGNEKEEQNPTFVCSQEDCESAFFSEIRLKIHLKRIHNISSEPSEINKKHKISKYVKIPKPLVSADGSPLFNCPLENCTSSFQAIMYLKKHLKRVHNIPPTSRPYQKTININPESNDHTKPKTYMCPVCGKILMLGSKEVHDATHENKKQYRCDICPSAFNIRQHLIKHRNMHTREKIHICSDCGKEFLRLEGLKLHQNTVHSDTRSFICEFPNCDKSYKIKRQLVLHQRSVHIVEKPYECNLCSTKSFHTELGLKDHLLRSHKNEHEDLLDTQYY